MVGGGGGSLKNTDAVLIVSVPTGSTVTATKGGVTITPTIWVQNVDNTLDTAIFSIKASTFDSNAWTVTATLGASSASTTVIIDSAEEYDLELAYNIEFVKDGILTALPWTIATASSAPGAAITQESGDVLFTTGNVQAASVFGSTDAYDLTNYSTLRLVITGGQSYYNANKTPCIAVGVNRPTGTGSSGSATNLDYRTMLKTSTGTILAGTFTLDVSTLTGLYYVGLSLAGSTQISSSSGHGLVRVTEFGLYK